MRSLFDLSTFQQIHSLSDVDAYTLCVSLESALKTGRDRNARREIARSLPSRLSGLGSEVQVLLSRIAALVSDVDPIIPTDVHGQSRLVRALWMRVQLASSNAEWRQAAHETLGDALDGMRAEELSEPLEVLAHCTASQHERLERAAIRLLSEALDLGVASASLAVAQIERALTSASAEVRRRAVVLLGSPVLQTSAPTDCLRLATAAVRDDDEVTEAALNALGAAGATQVLVDIVTDRSRGDSLRAGAFVVLGRCMDQGELDVLVDAACADPVALARACLLALSAAHMRGVFAKVAHLPRLLLLLEAEPSIPATDLARITFTERVALMDLLESVPPDDPRWWRFAGLLTRLDEPRVGALLGDRLRRTQRPEIAEAFITAAARCPAFEDEAAILAWLERLPRAALAALRVKGSGASVSALLACVRAPHGLGSLRSEAGWTYYALCDDKIEAYEELRYAPQSSSFTARIGALGPPVCDEWSPGPDADALEQLSLHGDARHGQLASELFRKQLVQCFAEPRATQQSLRDPYDGWTPTERTLHALLSNMAKYGERLIARGASIYSFEVEGSLSGQDLTQQVLFDWLEERPDPHVAQGVLELLATLTIREQNLRRLNHWWRARDPATRAAAVRVILAGGAAAVGFAFSLGRLAEERDPRVRRQALLAIAQHAIVGAEPLAREALWDANMNVRRAAASALAVIGSASSISALVSLLAHHDNEGLRRDCLRALDHCAGSAATAVLLAELSRVGEPRAAALLIGALAPRLGAVQIVQICRSDARLAERLLAALDNGEDFAPQVVAVVNLRLGRTSLTTRSSGLERALAQLEVEGFAEETARELCAEAIRHPDVMNKIGACIRDHVHEWTRWALACEGADTSMAQRLALSTGVAPEPRRVPLEGLLEIARRLAESHPDEVLTWCSAMAKHVPRAQQLRVVNVLRRLSLPPASDGLALYRALRDAAAALTLSDLERCVVASRPEDIVAILADAFQVSEVQARSRRSWNEAFCQRAPAPLEWHAWASTLHLAPPAEQRASLQLAVEARPPGLSVDSSPVLRPRQHKSEQERVEGWLQDLSSAERSRRDHAAQQILSHPGAGRQLGASAVLRLFLLREISVPTELLKELAGCLQEWPREASEAEQARKLLPYLSAGNVRRWIPEQLEAWREQSQSAQVFIDAADRREVIDFASRRVERGEEAYAQLLTQLERGQVLFASEGKGTANTEVDASLVPEERRSSSELATYASESRGDAAVFAIKELIRRGAESEPLLLGLTEHVEWRVRNAALRGLSQVASRDAYLNAAASMFASEGKLAPIKRLAQIVAHGRRHSALPKLIALMCSSKPAERTIAYNALLAFGPSALSALEKARSAARPDHQTHLATAIGALRSAREV